MSLRPFSFLTFATLVAGCASRDVRHVNDATSGPLNSRPPSAPDFTRTTTADRSKAVDPARGSAVLCDTAQPLSAIAGCDSRQIHWISPGSTHHPKKQHD